MADNVTVDTITGDPVVATDTIAGVCYQRMKLIHGNDGTNDGDVSTTNPLPVTGSVTGTISGTIYANAGTNLNTSALALETGGNLAGATTALQVIDDWDDSNYCNVNMNIAGVDVDGNSGSKSAQTLRVVIATDQPALTNKLLVTEDNSSSIKTAVEAIDNSVDGNYLNVNLNIAGTDITANAGAVAATTPRVTLASDDPAVTSLGSLDNAVDGNYINTNLNIAGTDVDGNSGNKSAQTLRVVIATDQPQLTAKLLVTEDSGSSIKTAVETLDNVIAVEGASALTSGTQIYGKYDSTFPTAVDDGDAVNILTDKYGRLLIGTDPNITRLEYTHADVSTAHTLVSASSSNYAYITSFIISVNTASSYWLEDGDAAAITGKFYLAANGGVSWSACPGSPLKTKTVNKDLNIKSADAGSVGVTMTYYLAP